MKYLIPGSLFATVLVLTGGLVTTGEPKLEPAKADTADVLKFLGTRAWKWTYRAPAPYKVIAVRLVLFTRAPSGEFIRNEICNDSTNFIEGTHTSDDILIICGSKDGHATLLTSFSGLTSGPHDVESIKLTDYRRVGHGDGGLPRIMGSEYLLLDRFKANHDSNNKDDLLGYVAVEIETR